jgi:peptidoglycan hydrolase-like protein with peptidoglycan-binding domain
MNTHTTSRNERPDPFGRLLGDDGSQDKFRGLSDVFNISSPVGVTEENLPDDVARVEIMMDHLGELDLRQTDGPTGFYGERLKQAVMAFQKKVGLPETGRLAPADSTMAAVKKMMKTESSSPDQPSGGMAQEAATLLP